MKKNSLFTLVHSLTSLEVRHVKKFATLSQKVPQKLLDFFDRISASDSISEEALKEEFGPLSVPKFKLKNLILASLRTMHNDEDVETKVGTHIQNSRILNSKGLYPASQQALKNAKELAKKYELWTYLIEITQIEQHRLQESEKKKLSGLLEISIQEIQEYSQKLETEQKTRGIYHTLFASQRENGHIEIEGDREMEITFLRTLDSGHPFWTLFYAKQGLGILERSKGNFREAQNLLLENIAHWDKHPNFRNQNQALYKVLLFNSASYHIGLGELEEAKAKRRRALEIPDHNRNEEAETFQNLASLDLLLALNEGIYDRWKEIEKVVETGLEEFAPKINAARRFSILYNTMILCMIAESYQSAWKWLETIISEKRFNIRKEVHYSARLLQLILFFELEYWDPPDSVLIRTYRYLSRKDQMTEFKKSVLHHIGKLSAAPLELRRPIFLDLRIKLQEIYDSDDSKEDRLGLQVVMAWVIGKLENRPINQILPF